MTKYLGKRNKAAEYKDIMFMVIKLFLSYR